MNDFKWKPLDETKVDYGQVFYMNIANEKPYTVSRLKLMPHSKISYHKHISDCEWYINEKDGTSEFCPKGECHCLANDSDEPIFRLSIKKAL